MLSIRFQSGQFFRLLPSVLALAVFFSACPDSPAADRYGTRREAACFDYEVRVGIGGYPMFEVSDFGMDGSGGFFGYYFDAEPYYRETLAGIYLPGLGRGYVTGVLSAEVDFNIKSWFTVTFGIGVNSAFQNVFDPMDGGKMGRNHCTTVSILPEARFNWLNRDFVRLYSSVGIGLGMDVIRKVTYEGSDTGYFPVFQITPAGISLGRKVYWFAECGIGLQYIGGMTGVGVRF